MHARREAEILVSPHVTEPFYIYSRTFMPNNFNPQVSHKQSEKDLNGNERVTGFPPPPQQQQNYY